MGLSTADLFRNVCDSGNYIHVAGDTLKKYQDAILEIAKDIVSFCEEEKIFLSLGGGSVLGAIRHKGFIPWDDDIDFNILNSDAKRFVEGFGKKFGDKYWIHTPRKKNYGLLFIKVREKGTVIKTRDDFFNDENGFFIDLFPFVNVPNFKPFRILHGFLCNLSGYLLSCRKFYKNRKYYKEIVKSNPKAKKAFNLKIFLGFFISFLTVKRCTIIANSINGLCKNNKSKYLTAPSGRKHYFGEIIEREKLTQTIKVPFMQYEFPIMKGYDGYLKSLYGDYMKIPPEEKREKHFALELEFKKEN